jgi:hypothetical protein
VAAEYSTRTLESIKDQLALHQTVVDDANDRVRAIEHERSHLTADYTARVERLQAELAVSSQRLMHTKMTIQARTDELAAATDRARALVRLTGSLALSHTGWGPLVEAEMYSRAASSPPDALLLPRLSRSLTDAG